MEKGNKKAQLKEDLAKYVKDLSSKLAEESKSAIRGNVVHEIRDFTYRDEKGAARDSYIAIVNYGFFRDHKDQVPKMVNEVLQKFGKMVFFSAKRNLIHPKSKYNQKIPNSRTLTSTYELLLEDLVHPATVIAKRIRYSMAGKKVIKYYLDEESRAFIEPRADYIKSMYHAMTGRTVTIDFKPETSYAAIPLRKRPAKSNKDAGKEKREHREHREHREKKEKTAD